MPKHEFTRVRQDIVRRTLRVTAKQQITPLMLRLTFQGDELSGFQSPSPDDHIKIILPAVSGQPGIMRDFTPRAWDPQAKTLSLDFALHPQGPAVDWARSAQPGDSIEIGGPRGSLIAPDDFDWYLLVGDGTALPSIARRMESLSSGAKVLVIALVENEAEEEYLGHARQAVQWMHTAGETDNGREQVLNAFQQLHLPSGDGFIWIAAEADVARAAYRYVVDTLAHPKEWVKAGGYWSAGKADAAERIG